MSKLIHYSSPNGNGYILPSGYTRLSGLKIPSDKTVNTGVNATNTTKAYLSFSVTDTSSDQGIFGCRTSYVDSAFNIWYTSGTIRVDLTSAISCVVQANQRVHVFMSNGSTRIDCGLSVVSTMASNITANRNILIGGIGNANTAFSGNVYFCRIWNGDTLVRDYIPVKKSDGTVGLLNLIDNSYSEITGAITLSECPLSFPTGQYCLVEWLEGLGNLAYINTGVKPSVTLGTRLVYSNPSYDSSKENIFFGASSQLGYSEGANYCMETYGPTNTAWAFGSGYSSASIAWVTNLIYNVEINYNGSGLLKINGEVKSTRTGQTNFPDLNLFLFGRSVAGSVDNTYSKYRNRLHRVLLFNGTTLIHDYIPCYRRSDMKPGMYDLVSRTFLTNSGTGEFLLGPSITFGWGEVVNGVGGLNLWKKSNTWTITTKTTDFVNARQDNLGFNGASGPWTISFDAVASSNISVQTDICDQGNKGITITTTKQRFFVTATAGNYYTFGNYNGFWDIYSGKTSSAITITISNIVMCRGSFDHPIPYNSHAIPHNISTGDGRMGEKNGAFEFIRTNSSHIEIPEITMNMLNMTVAGWIKFTNTDSYARLCDFQSKLNSSGNGGTEHGFLIARYSGTNKFAFHTYSSGSDVNIINTGTDIINGLWYHAAFTILNGTTLTAYVNGVLIGLKTRSAMPTSATLKFNWLGKSNWTQDPYVNAYIQDFLIWDEVKNPAELM